MSKIVFISNDYFALYNYRKNLIKQLVEEGNDVYALMQDSVNNKKITDLGAKVITVPMENRGTNPIKDLGVIKNYKKIIKSIKPDLIIAYTIKACIYGGMVARMLKIPFIATITGLGSAFQNSLIKLLVIPMYKISFKKAKAVFFQNTTNMRLFLEKNIIKENQVVLVNGSGVDLEKFKYAEYPNNDRFNILYIGRIMKEKGISELLDSIEKINNSNVEFYFAGEIVDDIYVERMKQLEEKHLIKNLGMVDNIYDYICKSNLVVLPSYHEGLSNAILEAGACGRPVIATNIHGCIEAIEPDKTGFICEKQNVDSLYSTILKALSMSNEQLKDMGINAYNKMVKEYDRKDVQQKYMDVINKLLVKE